MDTQSPRGRITPTRRNVIAHPLQDAGSFPGESVRGDLALDPQSFEARAPSPIGPTSTFEVVSATPAECEYPWQPGLWANMPKSGLLDLILALACTCGAAIVLKSVDGEPIDGWSVQPSTVLAVLTAVANASLRGAFSEGVRISWWTSVLGTSSLRDLHYTWSYKINLFSALTTTKGPFSLLRLAAIMIKLILIDGPLIQRSLAPTQGSQYTNFTLTVPISPGPYLGVPGQTVVTKSGFYTNKFRQTLLDQSSQEDITIGSNECQGICEAEILAAGFDVRCQPGQIPTKIPDPLELASGDDLGLNSTVFSINVADFQIPDADLNTPSNMVITSLFKEDRNGLTKRTCFIREAIVRYPIRIQNNTVQLRSQRLPGLSPDVNHTHLLLDRLPQPRRASSLTNFHLALFDQFNTSIKLLDTDVNSWKYDLIGSAGRRYSTIGQNELSLDQATWQDPTQDIISYLWDLSFRAAVQNQPGLPGLQDNGISSFPLGQPENGTYGVFETGAKFISNQKVDAQQTESIGVFDVRYGYLLGAMALMFLTTLSIIPTFYGWWRHGRWMSMNPIETAKAFNAPFFRDMPGNIRASQIVKRIGEKEICYGVTLPSDLEEGRLVDDARAGRLEMIDPSPSLRPRPVGPIKGQIYI